SHLYTLFCIEHPAITYLYTLSLHDALPIYNLEKTVLDDKAAVIERAVLLQQITQIDTIIKIANLGNEQDVIPARSAGAGECQNGDRKSTRLNSSHVKISYAVFCLKKKLTAG